jgi:hypothetical protein
VTFTLRRSGKTIGHRAFPVGAHGISKIKLRMSKAAFGALQRAGNLGAHLRVRAAPTGNAPVAKRIALTLKAPR